MLMGDTFTTAMKTFYSNLNAEVVNLMHGDSSQIILGCVFSLFFCICACATVDKLTYFHICQYITIFAIAVNVNLHEYTSKFTNLS